MKLFAKFALIAVLLSALFGCVNPGESFQVRLTPPDTFNPVFLRYKETSGEKVIVVAIDPGGNWAFGYDHSRDTLQEAAMNAAMKCDKAREKHKVFTKARIFAINDTVVYYDEFK